STSPGPQQRRAGACKACIKSVSMQSICMTTGARGATMIEHEQYPLSPYDEYPVHQSPYPISYVPATDYAWDEGYFYGVYSADAQVLMLTGMRINPNADVIGRHAGATVGGGK